MISSEQGLRANYITNLAITESSGGWSGFNVAIYESLTRHFALTYVGPISPSSDYLAKIVSKAGRILGGRGRFSFFSPRRLRAIAHRTEALVSSDVAMDFFHGSTPWICYDPPVPYACYLDACFATYVDVYHDRSSFLLADLDRIEKQEAAWLRGAARVFFSSAWGLGAAVTAYGLELDTLRVAGLGGYLPIPVADTYDGGFEFLFISLDFRGKGGHVCADAFARVRSMNPQATLRVIGERPPANVIAAPGVIYEGYLRKSVPHELTRLRHLFASAFALVHPTVRDATPQVIIEAQYHGCPTIAPRSFGIPEMIVDGVTGFLVDSPPTVDIIAQRMLAMCNDSINYPAMRRAAREYALEHFTWEQVGNRMAAELYQVLQ